MASSKTSGTEEVNEGLSEEVISIVGIDKITLENNAEHKKTLVEPDNKSQSCKKTLQTYHSLVESYNQTSTNPPDLHNILQKLQRPTTPTRSTMVNSSEYETETVGYKYLY